MRRATWHSELRCSDGMTAVAADSTADTSGTALEARTAPIRKLRGLRRRFTGHSRAAIAAIAIAFVVSCRGAVIELPFVFSHAVTTCLVRLKVVFRLGTLAAFAMLESSETTMG